MNAVDLHAPEDALALATIRLILSQRKLEQYVPYPKQHAFHDAGGLPHVRERLLMAANQVGKTVCAGFETVFHLTGKYPDEWEGHRFTGPTSAWAASNSGQSTRDTVQRILLGRPGEWGTGAIPRADLAGPPKRASGSVPDLVETILVKHVSGGTSTITIKSYDQGRLRWQGETLHFVWFDEEPPLDIYTEGLTRTNATKGIVFLTFTPLLGISDVVRRFLVEKVPGTHITTMTIEDAGHYTPEERAAIIRSYPAHEREARAKGIPVLGSGRIFPVTEEIVKEEAFHIPIHWVRIAGMDIGYDHPTAAVWMAWDRDVDTVHVYDAYKLREASPSVHSVAIKARGAWIPVAWPHDALQHDKGGSCEQIAKQYRDLGVNMLPFHATHPPAVGQVEGQGGYGREAGIMAMLARLETGRLKVAAHLHDWWEEYRLYHRKDGQVVVVGDDLMSATRIGLMMMRKAHVNKIVTRPSARPQQPFDAGTGPL